jgi:hypothetical protein
MTSSQRDGYHVESTVQGFVPCGKLVQGGTMKIYVAAVEASGGVQEKGKTG